MSEQEQIDELFDRCIELEHVKYGYQDKIEKILDYLVKSHITVEEMEKVQEIAYKKENN